MFGVWFKERCSQSNSDTACRPEQTCAGDTGTPMTHDQSTYFSTAQYSFDGKGCYHAVTTPAVAFYKIDVAGTKVNGMIRVRRIWQFPSYSPTSPLPGDVYNREAQVLYTSSDPLIVTNYGWMLGDVVPLNSCAYVVSQSTVVSGANLLVYYNFE